MANPFKDALIEYTDKAIKNRKLEIINALKTNWAKDSLAALPRNAGIGALIGVGIVSSAALLGDELRTRADVVDALRRVGNIRQNGYTGYEFLDYRPMKLMSYLEGLNSNGDNYNSRHLLDSVFGKANEVANARYNAPIFYQPGSEFNTLKKDALKKAREKHIGYKIVNHIDS